MLDEFYMEDSRASETHWLLWAEGCHGYTFDLGKAQVFTRDEALKQHQMHCKFCDKNFVFTTHVSFCYTARMADCLNDYAHRWRITKTNLKEYAKMRCEDCGEEKGI